MGPQSADGASRAPLVPGPAGDAWASDEHVVDLGVIPAVDPDEATGDRHRRRLPRLPQIRQSLTAPRVSVLVVIVVALLAGAAGAAITYQEQAEQRRIADESAISLVLVTDPLHATLIEVADGHARFSHRVNVVNTGPLPVEVSHLGGGLGGLLVISTPTSTLIEPGAAAAIDVDVSLHCGSALPRDAVPLKLDVRTRDGQVRHASKPVVFTADPMPLDLAAIPCGDSVTIVRIIPGPPGG